MARPAGKPNRSDPNYYPEDFGRYVRQRFFRCCGCQQLFGRPIQSSTLRRCEPCSSAFSVARRSAISAVGRAIRFGQLRHPSFFACVDCGAPARDYEHRSYNRPLDVEPVCRGCNARRGPARWEAA